MRLESDVEEGWIGTGSVALLGGRGCKGIFALKLAMLTRENFLSQGLQSRIIFLFTPPICTDASSTFHQAGSDLSQPVSCLPWLCAVYVCVLVQLHACAEAKGQDWVSFLITFQLIF